MYALLRDATPVRLGAEEAARHIDQAAELLRPAGHSRYLLIAEHAGNLVPEPWSDLGLPTDLLSTHYGLDIGVDALTRNLSERMNAPAVLARYSRLFLDYNRRAEDWDALRPDLGGIPVPANLVADAEERALREAIARSPVDRMIESASPRCQALVSVHSFSPLMHGTHRDVDIGILWCERSAFTEALFDRIHPAAAHLGLRIGDNEPYGWRREHGYTLNRHGLDQGMAAVYLELRNSLLSDAATVGKICQLLAMVFDEVSESLWPDAES